MAEVKDKIITVESLKALHDYNQGAYMPIDTTAEDIGVYTKEQVYTKEEVDAAIKAAIEAITNSGSEPEPEPEPEA